MFNYTQSQRRRRQLWGHSFPDKRASCLERVRWVLREFWAVRNVCPRKTPTTASVGALVRLSRPSWASACSIGNLVRCLFNWLYEAWKSSWESLRRASGFHTRGSWPDLGSFFAEWSDWPFAHCGIITSGIYYRKICLMHTSHLHPF